MNRFQEKKFAGVQKTNKHELIWPQLSGVRKSVTAVFETAQHTFMRTLPDTEVTEIWMFLAIFRKSFVTQYVVMNYDY